LRSKLGSPGRPSVAQPTHRWRFWVLIAGGLSSEDAAIGAGVSAPVRVSRMMDDGHQPACLPQADHLPLIVLKHRRWLIRQGRMQSLSVVNRVQNLPLDPSASALSR
jgi:hypothetical protein